MVVRWSSSGEGGGGGGKGEEQKRAGFVQNFLSNLRKSFERNKEMQESLQGLQEERHRMKQSYVVQAAKERLTAAWTVVWGASSRGVGIAREGWGRVRDRFSKVSSTAQQGSAVV